MAVGLILVNVWIMLKHQRCRFIGREEELIVVERRYGIVTDIDSFGQTLSP